MLKSEKNGVVVKGTTEEIMLDLVLIIKCVFESFKESHGEDFAKMAIADAGRMAFNEDVSKCFEEVTK